MARSIVDAGLVAGGTALAHFGAHAAYGDVSSFEPAGVLEAGGAVFATAFLLSLVVGQEGGLALQGPDGQPESRAERARRRLHPV